MPPRLTVLQHHMAEGPGNIAHWAQRRGIELDIVPRFANAPLRAPRDGLVLLGGPQSVVDPDATLREELDWLSRQLQARPDLPVLGICLGAQLLARALCGDVRPLGFDEIGWQPVDIDVEAGTHALDVLQWHEDGFSIPPGAQAIASGRHHATQGFALRRCIGLQFHPEWNASTLADMREAYGRLPFDDGDDAPRQARMRDWLFGFLDAWMPALALQRSV